MKVAIRADAGPIQGSGHVMRCRTLAEQLLAQGHKVTFYTNIDDLSWLEESLASMNLLVKHVERNNLAINELAAENFDLTVVDSYEISVDEINSLATLVPVLAIVDEPNPNLRVHAVLDQNLGAEYRHKGTDSGNTLKLLGSRFSLVREEFLNIRIDAPRFIDRIEDSRLLCFFGGSDPSGAGIKIASILSGRACPQLTILAPQKDHAEIRAILGTNTNNVELLSFTTKLPSLINASDTVVCAAGTSAWDLATIGMPTAYVSIASNQDFSLHAISVNNVGICLDFDDSDELNYQKIRKLVESSEVRRNLFKNMRDNFDGMGAKRVCHAIHNSIHTKPLET
jgi:spore coat polysaccharide biosynthesis predicted glycosyltransferase SpsG